MWKKGDRVVVLRLHVNGADGAGTVLRQETEDHAYPGYWVIDIDDAPIDMYVEPDRLVAYDEYYKNLKSKLDYRGK